MWLTRPQVHELEITVYLTAEAAYAGLADHAEQLRLSRMLVAEEAYACFIINANKAWVRCRERSTSLQGRWMRKKLYSDVKLTAHQLIIVIAINIYYKASIHLSAKINRWFISNEGMFLVRLCWWASGCTLTSHISPLCVAELLALMVNPSPSRSPSRSLSPGTGAPAWEEGDGDGGCSASVQNNVRGPWSSQKWQRATRAFIWKGGEKEYLKNLFA